MAFVTIEFILFILVVFGVYFAFPKSNRWLVLLIASYVFYVLSSKWLVFVMLATTLLVFFTGRAIGSIYSNRDELVSIEESGNADKAVIKKHKEDAKKKAKGIMLFGALTSLVILIFLKYYGFITGTIDKIAGTDLPKLNLLLPLGISFYTLQAMAYVIDVYREKIKPDTNPLKFMLFMSYFPQIVQGPIPRHKHLAEQLYEGHDFDYDRFTKGVQLILWGFMKKLIIADKLAIPVASIFNNYDQNWGLIVFLGGVFYGLQVYADFSGGMDIARGVSQVLGIEIEMNFNQPYFSTSVEDFWRRWHITLGGWMRDYVFYPLSLSKMFTNLGKKARKVFGANIGKKIPPFIAMFIVYFLVGIWHGSSWKYAAYGIYNGIFIMFGILLDDVYANGRSKLGIKEESRGWKLFQIIRTFIIVSIGRMMVRAYRFKASLIMFKAMTHRWWDLTFIVDGSLKSLGLNTANWIVLIIALIVLFYVDIKHEQGISMRERIAEKPIYIRWAIFYLAIIIVLIFGVYGPQYDAASFIYEQF